MDVIKQIDYMIACLEMAKEEYQYEKSYETEKEAMEELKLMLTCWKHKQDIYFIRQEKAVL